MALDMQVVTRGRYMAPGTPFTDVDKPLHLHITPGACSSEVRGAPLCALHSLNNLPLRCQVSVGKKLIELELPMLGL